MNPTGRRQAVAVDHESAKDHWQKALSGEGRPWPEPGKEPRGKGRPGNDPFDPEVDRLVVADEVAGHDDPAEAPQGERGGPEGRPLQHGSTPDRPHTGEYNGGSRGFPSSAPLPIGWPACSGHSSRHPRSPVAGS